LTNIEIDHSARAVPGRRCLRILAGRLLLVANPEHDLMPGMPARASVITQFRPLTMLLPANAIRDDRLLIVSDGVVRERAVRIELLSGISTEDLVVIPGSDGLREGSRVTYKEPGFIRNSSPPSNAAPPERTSAE